MANETTVTVNGFKELDEALKQFAPKLEGAIIRGGLRAGTSVFLKRARQFVPIKSGALRRSLRIRTSSKKGQLTATLVAGGKEAFYAGMVEFGTAPHLIVARNQQDRNVAAKVNRATDNGAKALSFGSTIVEQVQHPGSAPRPFMRPALDGGEQEALEAMGAYIMNRIEKELKK